MCGKLHFKFLSMPSMVIKDGIRTQVSQLQRWETIWGSLVMQTGSLERRQVFFQSELRTELLQCQVLESNNRSVDCGVDAITGK